MKTGTSIKLASSLVGLGFLLVACDAQTRAQQLAYPGKSLREGTLHLAKHYEALAAKDPQSVPNLVGICEAYTMHWCFGFATRDEVLPAMKKAAQRAVALESESAAARTALGIVKLSEHDWAAAESELAAAVRLDPNRAPSQHWYALFLSAMGRHEEALKHSEQAVILEPSPGMQTGLGSILYFGRDWPRMIRELSATTAQHPEFAYAYDWLGMAYVQEERFDESIETYLRAVELSEGLAEILAGLGHAYGLAGRETEARAVLEKLLELDKRWYVPPVQIAYVYVGLRDHENALRMLERARKECSWELIFLREEPWFDPIRQDARCQEIQSSLKFPKRTL